jgi:cytochrome c553
MHNSQDGALVDPLSPLGNEFLLQKADPSTVCIACHDHLDRPFPIGGDPLVPPSPRPAGNFIFLLEDNLNDGHGGAGDPITGDAAGHNIIATEYGLNADGTLLTAPGGTFPASELACTSCHDPHGTTDFRFLYGTGRGPVGLPAFTAPAPIADGTSIFSPELPTNHTAYKSGMSAWCGNCHGDFHDNGAKLIHPSGSAMGGTRAGIYNLYNGSDDLFGGAAATAYLNEVPFEDPANTTISTAGPSGTSQVSCITCHRAHATSATDAGRWDHNVTFLEEDGHESGSYKIPNPYTVFQRSLCNKCHIKDEFDALVDGTPPPPPPPAP